MSPASLSPQQQPFETGQSFGSDMTVVSAEGAANPIRQQSADIRMDNNQVSPPPRGTSHNSPNTPQPLPKGAMATPSPQSMYRPEHPYANTRSDTPPSTPSAQLLPPESPSHVQFATYHDDEKNPPRLHADDAEGTRFEKGWVPWPLRPWFWIPFVLILTIAAIGLEVALHFSNKNQGWPSSGDIGNESSVLHYVYTLPPVAVAAILVAMWTWTDIEIKKMQPYVDLVHGDSPPHRSLLLDYTRTNNFIVWTNAASNKHYLVALASLMVILSLAFQPLAAALLVVKDTWWQEPDVTLNNMQAIGLNQDLQFNDLSAFLAAAGYASAAVLYNLADPPFVNGPYTVAQFQLPTDLASNGTVIANTTAIKSETGCQPVNVQMTPRADSSGWDNSATFGSCSFSWSVDNTVPLLFGTDTANCDPAQPPQFSPVIFWLFAYQPQRVASATFCYPKISLWDVNVNVNLANGSVTKVTELRPFTSSSNFSSFSANVTGQPLNGRAYNGIQFNLSNPDEFVRARRNATQLQLPASVYQAALLSPQGIVGSFESGKFVELSNQVYRIYLTLIAKSVYFLPAEAPLTMQLKTFRKRVWLSDTAVHLLAAALLLLAFFGTIVHFFHRFDRRNLRLRHEPGTIASAVSIGAQTGMGNLLAGRQDSEEISKVLQNKKFRIDPHTMKIIMEGEEGYEYAASPMERRKSIFATLQGQGRLSRRFSKPPSMPSTPKSSDSGA